MPQLQSIASARPIVLTTAEIVQLDLRDQVASVVRPVRELKDFRKV